MPELPEVETIRRELRSLILNKKIKEFVVRDKVFLKKPKTAAVWKKIIGRKIRDVERRGKFLILKLNGGYKIVIHFKLTGQLLYGGNDTAKIKIVFSDNSFLGYFDKRRFGEWFLITSEKEIPLLKEIGVDPTDSKFSLEVLKNLLDKKKTSIYKFLFEQRLIAGIGNIYANEILYRAKLNPLRKIDTLETEEITSLYYSIKDVLSRALKARGSSIDSYLDIWGNPGKYSYEHVVYGKEGQFCPHCPNKIMRIKSGNRSIYFCPGCQQ